TAQTSGFVPLCGKLNGNWISVTPGHQIPGVEMIPRGPFVNEIPMDFSIEENRGAMQLALKDVKAQLGKQYPLVINGEKIETGEWIRSTDPGNPDQVVGEVARASAEHVDQAIAAAEEAFKTWRLMPAE